MHLKYSVNHDVNYQDTVVAFLPLLAASVAVADLSHQRSAEGLPCYLNIIIIIILNTCTVLITS